MNAKRESRSPRSALSDETHEDDGIDPRIFFDRRQARPRDGRKARMLCAQVAQCLRLALPANIDDPVLQFLEIVEVVPTEVPARLEVHCEIELEERKPQAGRPQRGDPDPLAMVHRALLRAEGRLRELVAAAIHRKRAPELQWTVTEKPHE